jgi:phosphate transport system protein
METADLSHHISRRFNEDLERVRNKVLTMGGMVEQQLANAVTALIEGDSNLGVQVARDDFKVNGMEVSIDEECQKILATRAPAAGDLRVIVSIIKTITDLERIGDEGEKIGYIARGSRPWSGRRTSIARSSISAASSRRWCTRRSTPSRAWMPRPRCA